MAFKVGDRVVYLPEDSERKVSEVHPPCEGAVSANWYTYTIRRLESGEKCQADHDQLRPA